MKRTLSCLFLEKTGQVNGKEIHQEFLNTKHHLWLRKFLNHRLLDDRNIYGSIYVFPSFSSVPSASIFGHCLRKDTRLDKTFSLTQKGHSHVLWFFRYIWKSDFKTERPHFLIKVKECYRCMRFL